MTDRAVRLSDGTSTRSSLLERAANRQVDAWDKLVSLYGPLVYRWCRRWGLQPSDAENVGQEVFARLATHLAEFHHHEPGDTFRGWLCRIAYRCFVDFLRQQEDAGTGMGGSTAQALLAQVPAPDAEQRAVEVQTSEDRLLVYRRIMELIRGQFSDRDWSVFYQVVIDRRAATDVAAELKVSVNVVYLAKSRVLRRVRDEFAGLLPSPE